MSKVRCLIARYKPDETEPPFTFIPVDECEIEETLPDDHPNGRDMYRRMRETCQDKGYDFRFYSTDASGYKYQLVVSSNKDW